MMPLRSSWLVAALATPLLAAPATASTLDAEALPRGPLHLAVGAQQLPTQGLATFVDFRAAGDGGELVTNLLFTPSNFTGFFVGDVYAAFVGQTGSFLPLNLMPFMGLGGGMYMVDRVTGTTTTTDASAYIYTPIGARLVLPLGFLTLEVGTTYFHSLFDVMDSHPKVDPSRWRHEAGVRLGGMFLGVYQEQGTTLTGLGARAGLNF